MVAEVCYNYSTTPVFLTCRTAGKVILRPRWLEGWARMGEGFRIGDCQQTVADVVQAVAVCRDLVLILRVSVGKSGEWVLPGCGGWVRDVLEKGRKKKIVLMSHG